MTPALCRAARGLLNWTQVRLAAKAGISEGTVRDFESGLRTPSAGKLFLIRKALHAQGVIFIPEGPGVRLKGSDPRRPSLAEGEAGIIANSEM
ncbi:helix-turn-helix transcriptional regulator [Mesorhizobium sp. CU2]|nr:MULTISPECIES: helix-turn-helix transcriptional regulator [unclassified Mesorhizobium]TPN86690.1 helix-turn-helix transcriptional regulator [Mesorhizobium sp. CU3]TPO20490.1 helix-turn-helix transcriptional regulator [Mesorhizobium sp. CU2]